MRITESQLRRMIRQTINEMAGPADNVEAAKEATLRGDVQAVVAAVVEMSQDPKDMAANFESILDELSVSGKRIPPGVVNAVHDALGKEYSAIADKSVSSSPDAAVLKALAKALSYRVTPDDVKYITIQPRRTGGAVTKISLEHRDPDTGISYSSLLDSDISGTGMTLDDVAAKLVKMGAKSRARRSPIKHSHYYD